jgi:iron only hydrogenase large subunit-like protein
LKGFFKECDTKISETAIISNTVLYLLENTTFAAVRDIFCSQSPNMRTNLRSVAKMQAKKTNANNSINSVLIVLIGFDDIIDGDNQVALDLELDEGEDVVLADKMVSAFKL